MALEPGDLLTVYTDGITEASRTHHGVRDFFETARLDRILANECRATARDCVERVTQAVSAFSGRPVPADDQTLLVIRVN